MPDAEVQQPPEAQALTTHHSEAEPASAALPVKVVGPPPLTREQRRRGGQKGGHNGRAVALIGLGLDELPPLSLRTSADRMAVLEATLAAVARGRTSGLVASTITAIVRAANELARSDQEDQIRALEARVEQLVGARVVNGR
jgi:hypothetical protein